MCLVCFWVFCAQRSADPMGTEETLSKEFIPQLSHMMSQREGSGEAGWRERGYCLLCMTRQALDSGHPRPLSSDLGFECGFPAKAAPQGGLPSTVAHGCHCGCIAWRFLFSS